MFWPRMIPRASPTVASGDRVTGSSMTPLALRLTFSTSSRWRSIERLRCTMPRPPSRAKATARRHSVTVSIADELIGTFSGTFAEKREPSWASPGITSE